MKSHPKPAAAAGGGGAARAAFELKQRVALSLTKLADRDTQQIGADELHLLASSLAPDAIAPFLSSLDADADHKPAVRTACVRVLATLAKSHGPVLAPHLSKMAAGVVKRLKDADSVVRDACVDAAGVLVSNVEGGFVTVARPLFEKLGEQNRYVQAGAAMCLARVIDEAVDPPEGILPPMLVRVVKLLKNPHFTAKPAVIELIRSIIQAGGASTDHALSTPLTAILEALKSSDWTTRKAASLALADIAVTVGPLLGSFKASCIRSLECCRFDKVKPVRDVIAHAIQCWKSLSNSHFLEPSETGSSTKENFGGDYPDVTSASDGGWREVSSRKVGPVSALSSNSTSSSKKRIPLAVKRSPKNVQNHQYVKPNDWHVEISLPKSRAMPSVDLHHEESGGSCTTKAFERAAEAAGRQDMKQDYDSLDKNHDIFMSDRVSVSFETKHVTVDRSCLEDGDSTNHTRRSKRSATGETDPQGVGVQDHKSMDSTVTESCSRDMRECCLHTADELAFIKKQLLEIKTRQSDLMDLLQVFMGNSKDNISTLQLKVHDLEHTVDKMAQGTTQNESYSSLLGSKLLKKTQSASSSPRISTCTSRPSVDSNHRQLPLLSSKNREIWRGVASSKSRSSRLVKDDQTLNVIRSPITKGYHNSTRRNAQSSGSIQTRDKNDIISFSDCDDSNMQSAVDGKASLRKRIKDSLYVGDVECAYVKALCSGDDLILIELMNRTGPVLGNLSHDTASGILSTVAPHFLNNRFLDSIIPWLQQVVDLSSGLETMHFILPTKARMEFLLAMEEVIAMEFADPADRTSLEQLAAELNQVWGEARKSQHMRTTRARPTVQHI